MCFHNPVSVQYIDFSKVLCNFSFKKYLGGGLGLFNCNARIVQNYSDFSLINHVIYQMSFFLFVSTEAVEHCLFH